MRDVDQEQVQEKRARRIGEFIDQLGSGVGVRDLPGGVLTAYKVRFPTEEEPNALVIVRARTREGLWIAFVGAYGLGDAVLAWRARQAGKGMRWREDVPYDERK